MYYRVAIQVDITPTWKWKSTSLSSLSALFQFLRLYRVFSQDRLRVFSSASREELLEQLVRENRGLGSTSVTAAQFLQERRIAPQETARETLAIGTQENERTAPIAVLTEPTLYESHKSPLDMRRKELEIGLGSDHDLPYLFTLPTSMPQVLAWVKLLERVQQGDLQLEVLPEEEQQLSSEGHLSVHAL